MNFDSMSWVLVMALSLSVFSLFIFLFSKFVGYMKRVQNLEIESFKKTAGFRLMRRRYGSNGRMQMGLERPGGLPRVLFKFF